MHHFLDAGWIQLTIDGKWYIYFNSNNLGFRFIDWICSLRLMRLFECWSRDWVGSVTMQADTIVKLIHINNHRCVYTYSFKNTYELLNLRALKFWPVKKSTSFNVWARYFVGNFKGTLRHSTENIFSIHWKVWFLYIIKILRALRFNSSYAFLKRPPEPECPVSIV